MPGPRELRARAYAKVNLSLRVLGRRADGYHDIQTIFQSIALHDTLKVQLARGPFRLACDDPLCPADRTNLVWRAAARVWRASGRRGGPRDVAISLTKRIPVQAGFGGGSSDAAATLRLLGSLWGVGEGGLRDIASSLGSDVSYFLDGGTALGLDRGDRLFPLIDAPPSWVALVIPDFRVNTADAYSWFDDAPMPKAQPSQSPLHNDLQAPVAAHHPDIERIAAALRRAGATSAAMTGSGSGVFGLFSRRIDAARAAGALRRAGRRTLVTRSINRLTYQRLAAVRPIV